MVIYRISEFEFWEFLLNPRYSWVLWVIKGSFWEAPGKISVPMWLWSNNCSQKIEKISIFIVESSPVQFFFHQSLDFSSLLLIPTPLCWYAQMWKWWHRLISRESRRKCATAQERGQSIKFFCRIFQTIPIVLLRVSKFFLSRPHKKF